MSPRPKAAQAPTTPDVDPLADLRDPEEVGAPVVLVVADDAPMDTVTADEWDRRRDLAVVAMHEDLTASGFLHRGGCGCRYIAGVALRAVLPVQVNEDDAPEDQ